jgi:hypothetical protein
MNQHDDDDDAETPPPPVLLDNVYGLIAPSGVKPAPMLVPTNQNRKPATQAGPAIGHKIPIAVTADCKNATAT